MFRVQAERAVIAITAVAERNNPLAAMHTDEPGVLLFPAHDLTSLDWMAIQTGGQGSVCSSLAVPGLTELETDSPSTS